MKYLHHEMTRTELVDWSESVMLDGELDPNHAETIREVVARLGLADVRALGLTWDDCKSLLKTLGYSAQMDVTAAQGVTPVRFPLSDLRSFTRFGLALTAGICDNTGSGLTPGLAGEDAAKATLYPTGSSGGGLLRRKV